jgi:hypothetical protein
MSYYSIALFLHIVGALGFFVALGLEWTGLWQLRSATTSEQDRAWMRIAKNARRFGLVSILTTLISGSYLMATVWDMVAWINVSLGALVLGVVLTFALIGPRMAAIERALTTEYRPVSYTFQNLVNHPLLWISIQTRVAIALGIVFLMTAKPAIGGSLLTIGVAIVLGLVSALRMPRRERGARETVDA